METLTTLLSQDCHFHLDFIYGLYFGNSERDQSIEIRFEWLLKVKGSTGDVAQTRAGIW